MFREPALAAVLAKEGGVIARELINMLILPDDPLSSLRGNPGASKHVAWAEPLDLEEVEAMGLNGQRCADGGRGGQAGRSHIRARRPSR